MLNVEVISSIDELKFFSKLWNETLSRSSADDVHLTWEWFYAWCKNFVRGGMFILLVKEEDKILAIAPFMRQKIIYFGFPFKKICALRNPYTPRFDIILTEREKECVEAIFKFLAKEKWDVVEFGNLLADSETLLGLDNLAQRGFFRLYKGRHEYDCPYIPVLGSWEDYYNMLSKKLRVNINRRKRKLELLGNVALSEIRGLEDIDKFLEKFFKIETSGWKERSGTAICCDKKVKGFYTDLAYLASKRDWLSIFFLKLNDTEVAANYCLRYRQVINLEKVGYDPHYSEYSPGILLGVKVIEQIFRGYFVKFDFLGIYSKEKKRLTHHFQEFVPIYIYRNGIYPKIIYYLQFGIKNFLKKFEFLKRIRKIYLVFMENYNEKNIFFKFKTQSWWC